MPRYWKCVIDMLKARVKLEKFVQCDLAYFGPRCSIFWYMRHIPWQRKAVQIDLTGTKSFTFHACWWKCILRRITSGKQLAIFYHLNWFLYLVYMYLSCPGQNTGRPAIYRNYILMVPPPRWIRWMYVWPDFNERCIPFEVRRSVLSGYLFSAKVCLNMDSFVREYSFSLCRRWPVNEAI